MKGLARSLRREMTRQERHLWYDFLRFYRPKFYRQRAIDRYIADFYCSKARLVVELDGGQHYTEEGLEYDQIRTDILERYGLSVIRFSNADIDCSFNEVCSVIDENVRQRTKVLSMGKINKEELTKEQIEKARACKTAEELMAATKAEGIEMTKDEAEAYLAELTDVELDEATLQEAAGGFCWRSCLNKSKA